MKAWLRMLDRLLRGELTRGEHLQSGLAEVPLGGMAVLVVGLGIVYGLGMGTFALARDSGPSFAQFVASGLKIPVLFFCTLLVTFPSLYVFNALVGSRLCLLPVLRLLMCGMAVTLAVLASFGPIVAFFSVSTTSYPFMVLLNVLFCTVGGFLGMTFLRQTLHRLTLSNEPLRADVPPAKPGALEHLDERPLGASVRGVFRCWMFLFALVGAQMSWVLRPFIGDPALPFTFFRLRESNFFAAVWEHFLRLF